MERGEYSSSLRWRVCAKDPNVRFSQLDTDCDKQVDALWDRARPGIVQALLHTYADLRDLPVFTAADKVIVQTILDEDVAVLNQRARTCTSD
jgi:hypothetical protein